MAGNQSTDLPTCTILLEGQAISADYQLDVCITKSNVNRIPEAEIRLLDGDAALQTFAISNKPDFIPGKKMEIKVGYHGTEQRIYKGIITGHAIKMLSADPSLLTLTLKHEAFKLTVKRNNRIFKSKKDSEAIEEILNEYGFTNDVAATDVTHEHLVQFNASDWDFIVMRAEINGMIVMCASDGKIIVKKPNINGSSKLTLNYGSTILEFEAEMDARTSFQAIKVNAWDQSSLKMKVEDAQPVSVTEQGNITADDLASSVQNSALKIFYGGNLQNSEMTKIATAALMTRKLSKTRGRIKCIGSTDVQLDDMITLVIADRFNNTTYVSGLRYYFAAGKLDMDIEFGLPDKKHAELFDDIVERPANGFIPAVNGLQIGLVEKLEKDPQGEDRVLVKIPMVSENDEAVWARVCTLDAGKDRGSFFRPELGDEVLLGFLNDDPGQAVILGMLNGSKNPAPLKAKDSNPQKGFITREKMKLIFDDDKKIITIETPGGNKITVSDDSKGITLVDQNNNKFQMNDSGISIESASDIKIKASGDVKIEGVNVELKASANLKSEGSAGASLKSSAITEVKGSMVNIN